MEFSGHPLHFAARRYRLIPKTREALHITEPGVYEIGDQQFTVSPAQRDISCDWYFWLDGEGQVQSTHGSKFRVDWEVDPV
jgi:hypothetical protein